MARSRPARSGSARVHHFRARSWRCPPSWPSRSAWRAWGWSWSATRGVRGVPGPFAVAKALVAGRPDRRCALGVSEVVLGWLPGLAGALLERFLAASAGRRWRLAQDARRFGAGAAAGLLELLEPALLAAKCSAEAAGGDPDTSEGGNSHAEGDAVEDEGRLGHTWSAWACVRLVWPPERACAFDDTAFAGLLDCVTTEAERR